MHHYLPVTVRHSPPVTVNGHCPSLPKRLFPAIKYLSIYFSYRHLPSFSLIVTINVTIHHYIFHQFSPHSFLTSTYSSVSIHYCPHTHTHTDLAATFRPLPFRPEAITSITVKLHPRPITTSPSLYTYHYLAFTLQSSLFITIWPSFLTYHNLTITIHRYPIITRFSRLIHSVSVVTIC